MMELNTARMEKVRDFLNRRKVVISIRVLGVACMFISQIKLIPFPKEWYDSFTFLVIDFAFLYMAFYKVDVKRMDWKLRILLIVLILLQWGIFIMRR